MLRADPPRAEAGAASQLCWSNRRPEDVYDERFFTRPGPCTVHVNEEVVSIPSHAPADLRRCCAHLYHGHKGYMLSDLIKQPIPPPNATFATAANNRWAKWADVRRDHLHDFPNSLAAEFVQSTHHSMSEAERFATLHRLVAARWRREYGKPPAADYLVVHLRVGDVIEEESHSLAEMLYDNMDVRFNQTGTRYVRRLPWYRSLDFAQMNVSRAVILAGSHLPYASFNRSCVYVHEVRKVLQAKGLNVELRCGRNADDDVVFASRAKWVAASSGGFSNLIRSVAQSFGAREAPHATGGRGHAGVGPVRTSAGGVTASRRVLPPAGSRIR